MTTPPDESHLEFSSMYSQQFFFLFWESLFCLVAFVLNFTCLGFWGLFGNSGDFGVSPQNIPGEFRPEAVWLMMDTYFQQKLCRYAPWFRVFFAERSSMNKNELRYSFQYRARGLGTAKGGLTLHTTPAKKGSFKSLGAFCRGVWGDTSLYHLAVPKWRYLRNAQCG